VDVFTKRNAVVGYATVKAASHYLERRRKARAKARAKAEAEAKLRRAWKPALVVGLGLVSFGILAGVAYAWRKSSAAAAQVEGEVSEVLEAVVEEAEAAGDLAEEAASEPIPAA
jgi:hypothetical protein